MTKQTGVIRKDIMKLRGQFRLGNFEEIHGVKNGPKLDQISNFPKNPSHHSRVHQSMGAPEKDFCFPRSSEQAERLQRRAWRQRPRRIRRSRALEPLVGHRAVYEGLIGSHLGPSNVESLSHQSDASVDQVLGDGDECRPAGELPAPIDTEGTSGRLYESRSRRLCSWWAGP